jgi:hypothetical protein
MGSTATLNSSGVLQTAAQTNITSLGTLTALAVDNITLDGNTISTTNSNGSLLLTPNGTGDVVLETDRTTIQNTSDSTAGPFLILDHITASPSTADTHGLIAVGTTDAGGNAITPFNLYVTTPDVTALRPDGSVSAATGKAVFLIKEDGDSGGAYLTLDGDAEKITLGKSTDITGSLDVSADAVIDGNVIVGDTAVINAASGTDDGFSVRSDGRTDISRAEGQPLNLRRRTDDGTIIAFYKEASGTTLGVGSIGANGGDLNIHSTATSHVGLIFGNTRIQPTDNAGAVSNGASDLGYSNSRFKDLYLSEIATVGNITTTTAGGTTNLRLGLNAGDSIADGALRNTVVGSEAGTALTVGDDNVAVGYAALDKGTNERRNVAVGAYALTEQLDAGLAYNVAVGYTAGNAVTTGTANTLIGGLAGDALSTSSYNVALGYLALSTETAGQESVAIGSQALATQNVGSGAVYNTAVGTSAGRLVTTGIQNTLIGGLAGDALTGNGLDGSGNRVAGSDANTAVGYAALSGDTKGNGNVAVGKNALLAQNFTTTEDSFNTAVGFSAGSGLAVVGAHIPGRFNTLIGGLAGDNITTGDSNIIIGHGIDAASATADGQLNIGGWITGDAGAITIPGTVTSGTASANGKVIIYTSDISSGENSGLNLFNSSGSDTSWHITPGTTGVDNSTFTIRDGTNNVNVLTLAASTGAATLANGLTLTDGNLKIAGSGHGIDFYNHGTGTNIDSNLLDDYEEGTYTATITPSGSGSIGLSSGFGSYTKIGNLVTVNASCSTNAISSPVGYFKISLPFTCNATNQNGRGAASLYFDGMASGANISDFIGLTIENTTECRVYLGDAASTQSDSAQQVDSDAYVLMSVTYRTA